jgi:hypothetical protein
MGVGEAVGDGIGEAVWVGRLGLVGEAVARRAVADGVEVLAAWDWQAAKSVIVRMEIQDRLIVIRGFVP